MLPDHEYTDNFVTIHHQYDIENIEIEHFGKNIKVGINQAKPVLQVWLQYAKVEMTPPTLKDIPAIGSGFSRLIQSARTGRYRDVTVREAVINTLVAAEIYCWFFVGECIGKRHIVGYNV